jgi:hypothetical protein
MVGVRILKAPCKRCGRLVTTTEKAIYPKLEGLKREFGVVCCNCITTEEEAQLNQKMMNAIDKSVEAKGEEYD